MTSPPNLSRTEVLVLAGGQGTRLRPVLGDLPKVLAPVGGKPFLFHLLTQLEEQGIRHVVLALGHGHRQVADWLEHRSETVPRVSTVVEETPLGTAGAIRFGASRLDSDPFFVMNGDTYSDVSFKSLLAFHAGSRASVTVAATTRSDPARYGLLETDDLGRVVRFEEKGAAAAGCVNAGIYVVSRSLLSRIPEETHLSWERDILPRLIGQGLFAFQGAFRFLDIGVPEAYGEASAFLESLRSAGRADRNRGGPPPRAQDG